MFSELFEQMIWPRLITSITFMPGTADHRRHRHSLWFSLHTQWQWRGKHHRCVTQSHICKRVGRGEDSDNSKITAIILTNAKLHTSLKFLCKRLPAGICGTDRWSLELEIRMGHSLDLKSSAT